MVGFPIRTSADRGLVDGSPQLFAVTHVLHRFLAPRHSPLALCSLERTRLCLVTNDPKIVQYEWSEDHSKMLVLALQFSRSEATSTRRRCRGAVAGEGDSLKTEEKTVAIVVPARGRDRIPDYLVWLR